MDEIISLAKRRGFIFQGSDIYGGLAGTWDYGPLGVLLKRRLIDLWWKRFVTEREDMYGLDAAILMNPKVWEASGHVAGFNDPLVEDQKTKKRFRADHMLEAAGIDPTGMTVAQMGEAIASKGIKSPDGNSFGEVRQFNMMFKTNIGATESAESISYLRPETAQGIFANFKNVVDTMHPDLPFGIAQVGKAFRNEIAPRDFIFRVREMEQMEIEYFIVPPENHTEGKTWEELFEHFHQELLSWYESIGLSRTALHSKEIADGDRAHYSKCTIDVEFDFPFGRKELCGLAYRTDFDLKAHTEHSKVDLSYFDEAKRERFIPHVIEPSCGVDRAILAVLSSAYATDEQNGEVRTYLKLSPRIAPYIAAVFPLLKNKLQLVEKATQVYQTLKKAGLPVCFDDNGNIGKRYRRQDEIGTPYTITVDFDTEADNTVTIRDRDAGTQTRMPVAELAAFLAEKRA